MPPRKLILHGLSTTSGCPHINSVPHLTQHILSHPEPCPLFPATTTRLPPTSTSIAFRFSHRARVLIVNMLLTRAGQRAACDLLLVVAPYILSLVNCWAMSSALVISVSKSFLSLTSASKISCSRRRVSFLIFSVSAIRSASSSSILCTYYVRLMFSFFALISFSFRLFYSTLRNSSSANFARFCLADFRKL